MMLMAAAARGVTPQPSTAPPLVRMPLHYMTMLRTVTCFTPHDILVYATAFEHAAYHSRWW
jgi:hypothetical protein